MIGISACPALWIVALSMVIGFNSMAEAEPPPGPIDPVIHAWFEALVRSDGMHCCGEADCRIANPNEVRASGEGFLISINGAWTPVPDAYVVRRDDNPLAATIICRTRWTTQQNELNRLYCVVPYSGG